jgi:hypothetical protein
VFRAVFTHRCFGMVSMERMADPDVPCTTIIGFPITQMHVVTYY